MSNFFSSLFRNFRLRENKVVLPARLKDVATFRRQSNPLAKLTPQRVKDLYEAFRKGQYADVQIAWDALEEYDETLATVVDRRQSALGEMDWEITIDAQTVAGNAEKQQLAEAQQDFLASYFSRIVNLSAAVRWLGLASFRSYAALEIVHRPDGRIEWMPVMPWFIARPDPEGPWLYNPDANPSAIRLEEMDRSVLILREVARPIDLPAMFLIVAKGHALTGWDEFLDVFGNPAVFFKLPQGVSDDERDDYARLMQELIGDGRGVYPDGGEIKTVETSASKPDVFSTRAEWCDKGIVRRGTGGMLTVLAEAGSGTLAGNAQQETFRMLASADASDISECINAQVVRPLLARKFPGKPALAGWYLNNRDEKDTAAQATIIATLAGAGYRASAEVVSEQVGFEVQDAPEAPVNPATGAAFTFNRSPEPPAPADEPPPVVENAKEPPAPSVPLAEAPLTPEELDLISAITSRGLEPSQIQKDAATVCEALQGAITSEAASLPTLAGVASANRRQNSVKGIDENEESIEEGDSSSLVENSCNQYRHDRSCSGAHNHRKKGSREHKSKPRKDSNKTNKQNKQEKAATRAIQDAIDGKGNVKFRVHDRTIELNQGTRNKGAIHIRHRRHLEEGVTPKAITKTLFRGTREPNWRGGISWHDGTAVTHSPNPRKKKDSQGKQRKGNEQIISAFPSRNRPTSEKVFEDKKQEGEKVADNIPEYAKEYNKRWNAAIEAQKKRQKAKRDRFKARRKQKADKLRAAQKKGPRT